MFFLGNSLIKPLFTLLGRPLWGLPFKVLTVKGTPERGPLKGAPPKGLLKVAPSKAPLKRAGAL